ncbi:MAG: type III secretion system chaperone [Pseudomonadota bacterium]
MGSDAAPGIDDLEVRLEKAAETGVDRDGVNAILADFARQNGLPEIALDADGAATLELDGADETLVVTLLHTSGAAGLLVGADMTDGTATSPRCRRLALMANGGGGATAGGVFGLVSGDSRLHLLHQVLLSGLDGEAFGRALMSFAELAASWRDRLDLELDIDADLSADTAT